MATEMFHTDGAICGTGVSTQLLFRAVDDSRFDIADLVLHVLSFDTPGATPTVTVSLITWMNLESEDGWVTLATFNPVTTSNTPQRGNVPKLLNYLRWKVTPVGTQAAVRFTIRGMLRTNGCPMTRCGQA